MHCSAGAEKFDWVINAKIALKCGLIGSSPMFYIILDISGRSDYESRILMIFGKYFT